LYGRPPFALLVLALGLLPALALGAGPEVGIPGDTVTVRGQVHTADGGGAWGLEVSLRGLDSEEAHRTGIRAGGRFELRMPAPRDTLVELAIGAADPGASDYHPVIAYLRADRLTEEQRVVLVPRRWVIPAGTHAGTAVEISLQRAYTPACTGCPSFYRQGLPDAGVGRLVSPESWPATAFPLRIAFDRGQSRALITARDSIAFWRIADAMARDYGEPLFRPARYRDALPEDGDSGDVILVSVDPSMRMQGLGTSVSSRGDIFFGAVRVRTPSLLTGADAPQVVTHELMHALGLGHTCAWRSAVAQVTTCPGRRSASLTAEDVAYTQVLARVREIQFAFGAAIGIEAALRGERALLRSPPAR
jgi:hypothetical protein